MDKDATVSKERPFVADIQRRTGQDVKAIIKSIVRQGDPSFGTSSAIATYTQGEVERVTTVVLGKGQDFKVGDPIKITPAWRHFTSEGVWLTQFSLAQDQS